LPSLEKRPSDASNLHGSAFVTEVVRQMPRLAGRLLSKSSG